MKRRVISAALALCMMLTLLSGTALAAGQHPFTDVPQSHWANEAVGYVYENDLMNGVSATMFQPGGSLTRAMFVTILGRMAGAEEESGESGFADVPAGRWYSAYVAWAAGEGIVDGTGNGCFSPNSPVTREQMATMIARYVDSADLPLPETGDPAAPFTDRNAVSDWAEAGVELMRQTGILAGYEDGTFQPTRELSRQEAAVILQRLYTVLYGKIEASPTLYADNGSIGVWAKDSVYAMRQTGIMQGVGANRFDPKNGYTCEQSIITMLRMTQKA